MTMTHGWASNSISAANARGGIVAKIIQANNRFLSAIQLRNRGRFPGAIDAYGAAWRFANKSIKKLMPRSGRPEAPTRPSEKYLSRKVARPKSRSVDVYAQRFLFSLRSPHRHQMSSFLRIEPPAHNLVPLLNRSRSENRGKDY
jgi:hypothetical protein